MELKHLISQARNQWAARKQQIESVHEQEAWKQAREVANELMLDAERLFGTGFHQLDLDWLEDIEPGPQRDVWPVSFTGVAYARLNLVGRDIRLVRYTAKGLTYWAWEDRELRAPIQTMTWHDGELPEDRLTILLLLLDKVIDGWGQ